MLEWSPETRGNRGAWQQPRGRMPPLIHRRIWRQGTGLDGGSKLNKMIEGRLCVGLILASVTAAPALAEDANRRFAKMYEVTAASAVAEPGEAFSTITVEATGTVNTGGWSDAELAAWSYIRPPADGILDFDLMARMPPDDAIVTMAFEDLSASISGPMPPWVRGIRIHASTNSTEVLLEAIPNQSTLSMLDAGGDPVADEVLPWPWKFFTPQVEHEQ